MTRFGAFLPSCLLVFDQIFFPSGTHRIEKPSYNDFSPDVFLICSLLRRHRRCEDFFPFKHLILAIWGGLKSVEQH